ncbi:MAG: nucleotidyltransferase family protein [Gaiellaceae bacterium]
MKAIVLAAGYATRLRPLTETWAKELLPVAGRPIIDWILDALGEARAVDEVHVVTNAYKAAVFAEWAKSRDVIVHDDGTTSNDDRLGAIGDLQFVIERARLDDDLIVIAGDNLFDYRIGDLIDFWRTKDAADARASAVAVRDVGSLELAAQYGIVTLDGDARVTEFEEKPSDPRTTLAATATYVFAREHAALIGTYLAAGESPDQPGRYVAWLHRREPVYGWVFDSTWYDIGDRHQLLEADNRMRERAGLPVRDSYSPD